MNDHKTDRKPRTEGEIGAAKDQRENETTDIDTFKFV